MSSISKLRPAAQGGIFDFFKARPARKRLAWQSSGTAWLWGGGGWVERSLALACASGLSLPYGSRCPTSGGYPCISLTRNETYGLARPRLRFGAIASLWVAMPDKRRIPVKFRRSECASRQNTHGSTSTSPNRRRPSATTCGCGGRRAARCRRQGLP